MTPHEIEKVLTSKLGSKSAKKLSKKFKLKKWGPILSLLLPILLQIFEAFSSNKKKTSAPTSASRPAPKASTPAAASRPERSVIDSGLQAYVDKALAYQHEINNLVQASDEGSNRERLQTLASQVESWVAAINTLVRRLDNFRRNKLIQQDLKSVPKSIARLEKKLAEDPAPNIRAELERTLAHRKNQQATLEKLQQTMDWAEIKIESTLSMLGTIYSQILAGDSKHHVADYRRLLSEVDEEVHSLEDYLEALDEVKFATY